MSRSYPILSQAYSAPSPFVRVKPVSIASQDIMSNQIGKPGDARPNVSSRLGEYRPDFIQIDNQVYAVTRTANKRYLTLVRDFLEKGPVTQHDDYGTKSWKFAGEGVRPDMFSLIPLFSDIAGVPAIAYIKGPRSHLNLPNPKDTYVNLNASNQEVMAADINYIGVLESKILTNLEQTIRSLIRGGRYHHEGEAWFNSLGKEGWTFDRAGTAGIRGLGILYDVGGEGYLWGYFSELGYLIAEGDAHKKIEGLAIKLGVTTKELGEAIETFKRADVLHEGGHIVGIEGHRSHERLQGLYRALVFSKLAKDNPELARIYRKIAEEGLEYAEEFSLKNAIREYIFGGLSPRVKGPNQIFYEKVNAEADALELEGMERKEFIDSRYKESGFIKLLETEPSFIKSKYQSKSSRSNNSKKSNLDEMVDEIIDESNRVSFTMTKDGEIVPTYNGRRVYGEGASMPTKFIGRNIKESKNGDGEAEETYEGRLGESEYKSIRDIKERVAKKESPQEAETAEASASN